MFKRCHALPRSKNRIWWTRIVLRHVHATSQLRSRIVSWDVHAMSSPTCTNKSLLRSRFVQTICQTFSNLLSTQCPGEVPMVGYGLDLDRLTSVLTQVPGKFPHRTLRDHKMSPRSVTAPARGNRLKMALGPCGAVTVPSRIVSAQYSQSVSILCSNVSL